MEAETFANAGEELHSKVKMYAAQHRCSYKEGFDAVKELEPGLARRYLRGESDAEANFRKVCEERERRVVVYQDHFNVNEKRAREMVDDHDPNMRNIPLDAGSVLDVRTRERMAKGEAKDYGQAMRAVLADDPLLAKCYRAGLPYVEASAAHAYQEDPMASAIVRAIVEPRPGVTVDVPSVRAGDFNSTAMMRLGILLAGSRKSDNSIDIPLALQIANLAPDLVKGAARERLDALTRGRIPQLARPGIESENYPDAFRVVQQENPSLVAAAESGRMTEEALREIYWPWFSRD